MAAKKEPTDGASDPVADAADPVSGATLYIVKSPLLHNQESFAIDSEVELTELEAAPLLAVRAVELKPMTTGGENG